jgi:hypothetical protein
MPELIATHEPTSAELIIEIREILTKHNYPATTPIEEHGNSKYFLGDEIGTLTISRLRKVPSQLPCLLLQITDGIRSRLNLFPSSVLARDGPYKCLHLGYAIQLSLGVHTSRESSFFVVLLVFLQRLDLVSGLSRSGSWVSIVQGHDCFMAYFRAHHPSPHCSTSAGRKRRSGARKPSERRRSSGKRRKSDENMSKLNVTDSRAN